MTLEELETAIVRIVKAEFDQWVDEGRSDTVANEILILLRGKGSGNLFWNRWNALGAQLEALV